MEVLQEILNDQPAEKNATYEIILSGRLTLSCPLE